MLQRKLSETPIAKIVCLVVALGVATAGGNLLACTKGVFPVFNFRPGANVPPDFQFRCWSAWDYEIPIEILHANDVIVPTKSETNEVPAAVVERLEPLYGSTDYYTTVEPEEPLAPGEYFLVLGKMKRPFAVVEGEPREEPLRIDAKPDRTIESAYINYDAGCTPIYERRPFLTLEIPAKHVAAGRVFEVAVYPRATRYDKPDNKSVIHGIPAPEESAGSFTIKIPIWWLTKSISRARAEDRWHIEVTAIDEAGDRGPAGAVLFNAPDFWNE